MGNSFNKVIFNQNVQISLLGWAEGVKKNPKGTTVKEHKKRDESEGVLLQNVAGHETSTGRGSEISEV